jgi:uncharacterized protein (TIGR01319 family)
MADERIASVDIGSTWTKGALFARSGDAFDVIGTASAPTTPEDLSRGFERVCDGLLAGDRRTPIRFSSSARGGLRIVSLGLVPDLTLSVARLAACSAGGKVVRAFAYRLTEAEVAEIERLDPDIILFTGGTDGGNEEVVLHNARLLAAARTGAAVLYAGNSKARDRVLALLAGRNAVAAANVMPEVGAVRIEPAQDAIRRLFLEKIVEGKGLSAVVARAGGLPRPTPRAVLDLVEAIPAADPGFGDFCAVDVGGATTDFYSCAEGLPGSGAVLLKGLREPRIKRTVEGDLGLRVSAEALFASEEGFIRGRLGSEGLPAEALPGYLRLVSSRPEHRPRSAEEEALDRVLARACVRAAARRHAGVLSRVFTPQGAVGVQRGKDLRGVRKLVGSGGFFSRASEARVLEEACGRSGGDPDERALLPEDPEVLIDDRNLFPLLGNLVPTHPGEAARTALRGLKKTG